MTSVGPFCFPDSFFLSIVLRGLLQNWRGAQASNAVFSTTFKVSVAVKGVLDFCLSLTLMETVARSEKRRNILKAICRYRTYGKVMRKFYLISSVFCFIFKTTLLFQITFRPEHFCLVKKRWNCLVVTTTYSSRSPLLIVTVFWVEFYPVLQYRNNIAHLEMTQSQ